MSLVVKGNAYGHGYDQLVPMLCELGVEHFAVFSAQEAYELRKSIDDKRDIMIMGDTPNEALKWVVDNGIEFYVFTLERIEAVAKVARDLGKRARIHLEVETGMRRTGLEPFLLERALALIEKHKKYIELTGVCTHLAGSESITNYLRIKEQIKTFKEVVRFVDKSGNRPTYRHCACSAAAVRYPTTRMDLVRIGILAYGFWPSQEILIDHLKNKEDFQNPLKRVMSWKTSVMAIKEVKRGDYVGYGTSFQAPRPMKLAILPVGYETGFSRSLSNKGSVLINGDYAYVVGTINMNALTVNISHVPDVKVGDEVVIIGEQGKNEITVAAFSDLGEQLNYEMLTRLPADIPREVVD